LRLNWIETKLALGRAAIKPRRDRLDTFALVLAASALIVLVGAVAGAINLANAPKPSPPTPGPAPTLAPADLTATQSAAATQSAIERALAATLAAAMQVTPGSAVMGINPVGAVPAPNTAPDFAAKNAWVGLVDGAWVSLYAGALRSDPQQGALLLVTVSAESVDQERFVVPLSHGALRISAQNVQRLTLVSPDGTTYWFDVLARRFVGSLTEYADTATPLPSPTATTSPTSSPTMTVTISTPGP
jgi:hypothetical protein